MDALRRVIVELPDQPPGQLGVCDDHAGVRGIEDAVFEGEDRAVAGIEFFDETPDRARVADFHPVAVQGIGNAEGIRREGARKGENGIGLESGDRFLAALVKGSRAAGGGGAVHLHGDVDDVGMDRRIEGFRDHEDRVPGIREAAAEVRRVSLRSTLFYASTPA